MNRIRMFIICDNQRIRRSLSAIFEAGEGYEVKGIAECSQDSAAEIQKIQPDAIVLESRRTLELFAVLKQIKEDCPYSKTFVLVHDDSSEVGPAINAGVNGCLPGDMLPGHLVMAVELACRSKVLCLPDSLNLLVSCRLEQDEPGGNNEATTPLDCDSSVGITPNCGDAGNGEDKSQNLLTAREMEIYQLIMRNYSNKEIGKRLFISQPTVKSHVSSILHKLGLNNRTQLLIRSIQGRAPFCPDIVTNGSQD